MVGREEICYLDTSALVKRYVDERGSEVIDSIFDDAYPGVTSISTKGSPAGCEGTAKGVAEGG